MSLNSAFSLELFFIDGKPDGMLTADVFNWTGHVLMTPRTRLKEALARREAAYTGVYILLSDKDEQPCAYIGESEDIAVRIKNHDAKMDWWQTAVLVTSAANSLNKAHVKYLEARLVEQAKKAARTGLTNGNTPSASSLSESDRVKMEVFLNYLLMVLPALRVDIFISKAVINESIILRDNQVIFELESIKHGLKATAIQVDGEFIVDSGSLARPHNNEFAAKNPGYMILYKQLLSSGVLESLGGHWVFKKKYSFSSPSAAAGLLLGRSSNGRVEWRVAGSELKYRDWEAQQLQTPVLTGP